MPATITGANLNAETFFTNLDLDPDMLLFAKTWVKAVFQPASVTLHIAGHKGKSYTVPAKLPQVTAICNGGVSAVLMKQAIKERVTLALQALQGMMGKDTSFASTVAEGTGSHDYAGAVTGKLPTMPDLAEALTALADNAKAPKEDPVTPTPAAGAMALVKPLAVKLKKAPSSPLVETVWSPLTPAEMKAMKPIALKNATRLYQPVTASSEGSVYFLVAGRPDLRIAARAKKQRLSVRAEGQVMTYKERLEASGFSKISPEYASGHFDTGSPDLAAKTLGAVLLGIGVPFLTAFPLFEMIEEGLS